MSDRLLPRWRSLLYVPANNPKFVAKAGQRGADGVILDLEDGVPPDAKEVAREAAGQLAVDQAEALVQAKASFQWEDQLALAGMVAQLSSTMWRISRRQEIMPML